MQSLNGLLQHLLRTINDFRYLIVALFAVFIGHRLSRLALHTYRVRQRYHDIPSLPRHWLFGNLKSVGEKCSPGRGRHPDYGFEEMWNELGRPSCFHVDLAPVDTHGFLVVAEPQVAETVVQISPEYRLSVPKADTMSAMQSLIGKESLITAEGEEWRGLRKRFNRGFAPAHIHALSPLIVNKTRIFVDRIREAAQIGQVVALKEFTNDLATDIITTVAIEKDFESQSVQQGIGTKSALGPLTALSKLSSVVATAGQGFDPIGYLNPVRRVKEAVYERIFNAELYSVLSQKMEQEQKQPKKTDGSAKAIVQLALAGLEPTPALLKNTMDQIKSFLFAGRDTTATLLQWMCYELSKADFEPRYRGIVERLDAEHQAVFGPGVYSALDILAKPGKAIDLLGDRIPYTTAFIKETLRLHPPAATARLVPEASEISPPFFIDINNKAVAIDGLRIYNCQWLIHRNPEIWGEDAHSFNPDRWLDEGYMSKLPAGAWRPFERGPRNCIGQELALMEAKVVLCAVTRGLRFEKVGLTGRNGEAEVWGDQNVTTVPVDDMMMRYHNRK